MGWYYVITQEMRENLEGKEVDVFAVINGYSQEGQGCFYGSLAKLSEFCGIKSKTTIQAVLKSLIEKGAITKEEETFKGIRLCSYKVVKNWHGMPKIDIGMPKIDTKNKVYNKYNTERENRRFTPPTIDEVKTFCSERNNGIDPEEFIAFYASKGWMVGKSKMKDWKSAIITWEKSRKKETPRRAAPTRQKESVFEHNLRVADEMFGTDLHQQAYGRREVYDEQ